MMVLAYQAVLIELLYATHALLGKGVHHVKVVETCMAKQRFPSGSGSMTSWKKA